MNRFFGLPLATALALATLAGNSASAAETSVASQAMQCYTMYTLMLEDNPADDFRNRVLGSQAMLMGTIYVMNAGTELKPVSNDQFQQATSIAESALLTTAQTDRQAFVDKLINCEGWREELLTHMALGLEEVPKDMNSQVVQEVMRSIPKPKSSYPLKGATLQEIEMVVNEALARRM